MVAASLLLVLAGLSAQPLQAQEDRTLTEEYEELESAYGKAALKWRSAQRKAKKEKRLAEFADPHPVHEYYPRFEELARHGDGQALLWIGLNVQELGRSEEETATTKRGAFGRLVEGSADQPYMKDFLRKVDRQEDWLKDEELIGYLGVIFEKNPDDDLRVRAAYKLAVRSESLGTKAGTERAKSWYEKIVTEFPDKKMAVTAKERMAGLNIAVGKVAPDQEMTDVDGATFKLSDYRGKVVVLDFWGFW